jgi:hypothetical protein
LGGDNNGLTGECGNLDWGTRFRKRRGKGKGELREEVVWGGRPGRDVRTEVSLAEKQRRFLKRELKGKLRRLPLVVVVVVVVVVVLRS